MERIFELKKMAQEKLEQSQISKLAMKSQLLMHPSKDIEKGTLILKRPNCRPLSNILGLKGSQIWKRTRELSTSTLLIIILLLLPAIILSEFYNWKIQTNKLRLWYCKDELLKHLLGYCYPFTQKGCVRLIHSRHVASSGKGVGHTPLPPDSVLALTFRPCNMPA